MNRLPSAIARVGLGLMFVCATLVGMGSSARASEERYVQIALGYSHTCGVLVSGSVKCWGSNEYGQLGLGYTSDSVSTPTLVPGLNDVASLDLGGRHTCAVLISGSVNCWGRNHSGQLGLGYISTSAPGAVSSPTLVPGLSNVVSLSLGYVHSCALLVSGSVTCWGHNVSGQLGLGYSTGSVSSPTLVPDLTDVAALDLGHLHSCALLVSGSVKCWGWNYFGQLGLGYTSDSVSTPTLVPGLTDVASLVLGDSHTCAVLISGSVKCWGYNLEGRLGVGYTSTTVVYSPTLVPGLNDVASLSSGLSYSCAVLVSGSVNCWGINYQGQLGLGYSTGSVSSPALVSGLTDVASVISGDYHTCAVLVSGSVKCWGYNQQGQLGLGYTSTIAPYAVSAPTLVPGVLIQRGLPAKSLATPTSLASSSVGATAITVTFNSPADVTADDPITAFEYSLDDGASWVTSEGPVTSSPLTISGLNYATTYSVMVRAVNSQGPGEASEPISVSTLAIPASVPSISSVVTASGRGTLAIAAPSVLGDTALTGYDYSTNNGSTWAPFPSVDGPFVITGLTNATAYQVKVRAVNSAGPGAASDAVTVNPTKLVPATPAIASITRGDGQATVNVKAPTGVTAQSITGYQYNINNGALWNPVTLTAGAFTVNGLTNGSNYSFKIRAVNANGLSGMSGKVSVTPMTTASATTIQSIKSLNGGLAVTFGGAINNGGSVAKNYQYSLDGGSTWTSCAPALKLGPLMTIKGLTNGTTYQVAIRLVNAVGPGEASNVVAATPMTTPSKPVISNASVGKTAATLTLGSSATGGAPITGYAYSLDNKTWTSVTPDAGQFTVSGLTSYKTYKFYVRTSNLMGNGVVASTTVKTLK